MLLCAVTDQDFIGTALQDKTVGFLGFSGSAY